MTKQILYGAVIAVAIAVPAAAQSQPPARKPVVAATAAKRPAKPSFGLYATLGSTSLAASETFDAIADTSDAPFAGGGLVINNVWKGLFIDGSFSRMQVDGSRVFVHGNEVYDLGIPLKITMTPIDVAAGWRFSTGRVSPYVGAGLSSISYKESSDFSNGDDASGSKAGALVLAGVDVAVVRWLAVGGELRYRSVKGLIGEGGLSREFGEDDIGGASAAVRVSFIR